MRVTHAMHIPLPILKHIEDATNRMASDIVKCVLKHQQAVLRH
jgi:hypothetical protein